MTLKFDAITVQDETIQLVRTDPNKFIVTGLTGLVLLSAVRIARQETDLFKADGGEQLSPKRGLSTTMNPAMLVDLVELSVVHGNTLTNELQQGMEQALQPMYEQINVALTDELELSLSLAGSTIFDGPVNLKGRN